MKNRSGVTEVIYEWNYMEEQPILLRTFLRNQGVSKRLLAKIKFHGGKICLNGVEENVLVHLKMGDHIRITVPDEGEHETTTPVDIPIKIVYEDEHLLIVDKPAGVASIPSRKNPHLSMANRVKGYYQRQKYADQVIHIVTRLDRDTTGLMLFAKNRYTHALFDQQLRAKKVNRFYYALTSITANLNEEHGFIEAPIGRTDDSIITREVREEGKEALTEYWKEEVFAQGQLFRIQLHTGRTHQIRVHFTHVGAPLIGDTLYGGEVDSIVKRQALHCKELSFIHPFTKEEMKFETGFPNDFQEWIKNQRLKEGR